MSRAHRRRMSRLSSLHKWLRLFERQVGHLALPAVRQCMEELAIYGTTNPSAVAEDIIAKARSLAPGVPPRRRDVRLSVTKDAKAAVWNGRNVRRTS